MLHRKRGANYFNNKIKRLKQHIRESIENQLNIKKGYNEFHNKLATLGYNDILTTNYDYAFEKSLTNNFIERKIELAKNKEEIKHSLKRSYYFSSQELTIWHIHGELLTSRNISNSTRNYPEESIMIGYEHYSSYLQRIQSNIKGQKKNQNLYNRLKSNTKSSLWLDIFFTHDIDIVGLGFDFSENHLWWLINYRANEIQKVNSKRNIQFNNRINFYYPQLNDSYKNDYKEKSIDEIIRKKNNIQKSKAIAEILDAFEVKPIPIGCNSFRDFYSKLIHNYLSK